VNPGAHEGFKSRKGVNPGAHEGFKSRRGVNTGAHEGFKTRKGVNPGAHEGFKSISIFFTSMKIYHCLLLDFVNLQKNYRNKDKNLFPLNTHT
jgi:hypothetical protein